VLRASVERTNSEVHSGGDVPGDRPSGQVEHSLVNGPLRGESLPYRDEFALDLSPFMLEKGDQLKLVVEVTDNRGLSPGRVQQSEPLFLEISDEAGVIAAITQSDERLESALGEVIQQQLGAGGPP
jgi:hypothetical protein